MKTVLFSIGLNVGAAEPADQLSRTLRCCATVGHVRELAMSVSQWQGTRERCIQVLIALHGGTAAAAAQILARLLEQDAIGILGAENVGWILIPQNGHAMPGGTLAEFPILARVSA